MGDRATDNGGERERARDGGRDGGNFLVFDVLRGFYFEWNYDQSCENNKLETEWKESEWVILSEK